MKTLNIMILGSSGRLGAILSTTFQAAGHNIITQSIRNWSEHNFAQLPKTSVDIVIHAANPEYRHWKLQALKISNTAIAIAKHYSATLMFSGNVYNFGQSMPFDLTVTTPQTAKNEKGSIRIAQEQAMQNAARAGLRCIIIRAGDFYGSGNGNWFDLVITKKIKQQKVCYPGLTNTQHAWAYLPDLAAYFVQIAQIKETLKPFEVIHFEGHTCNGNELIASMESAIDKKLSRTKFPWRLLRLFKSFVPNGQGLCEMEYLWRVPHRLCNSSAHKPRQNTPLIEAIRNTLLPDALAT
jgi:nucleoside-diphosphate-sugar epimerase